MNKESIKNAIKVTELNKKLAETKIDYYKSDMIAIAELWRKKLKAYEDILQMLKSHWDYYLSLYGE